MEVYAMKDLIKKYPDLIITDESMVEKHLNPKED